MAGPLISVIVPVYNTEKYLVRCLDSLRSQTYPNLEVLLVDDGSTDQSGAICDAYAEKCSRFRVIHQTNAGVSAARNAGIAAARGEWIGFADSDDYLEPDMFSYLYQLAAAYDADIAQCGVYWEEQNQRQIRFTPVENLAVLLAEEPLPDILWVYLTNSTWSKLFRKVCIKGISFDAEYKIGEDILFNLMALDRACQIVFGTDPKYHYLQHSGSVCHAAPDRAKLTSARRMYLHAEQLFAGRGSICRFCRESRLRNNLDICSKIVCNGLYGQYRDLTAVIRREMRQLSAARFAETEFTRLERLKSFLIGYLWPVYRFLLPKWKKISE